MISNDESVNITKNKGGIYTKKYAPFDLAFYEAFLEKKDATKQELFTKVDTDEKYYMIKLNGA